MPLTYNNQLNKATVAYFEYGDDGEYNIYEVVVGTDDADKTTQVVVAESANSAEWVAVRVFLSLSKKGNVSVTDIIIFEKPKWLNPDDIQHPLTDEDIENTVDGYIEGICSVSVSEMLAHNIETLMDFFTESMVGQHALYDIGYNIVSIDKDTNSIYFKVTAFVEMIDN